MGMLRIVEKGSDFNKVISFPHFYMNDFSVLGLVVSELPKAVDALQDKGILVQQEQETTWISFVDKQQLDTILGELTAGQIRYTLSDLVSCTYQG
ncbi:hypothetical protein [Desulfogranum marinum]|uniref:hypothetical protein n=1 Tax=Desulfogranum marinum TaxID=453220 RepID=UPI00196344BF|nr:hypothetical protein [Desulfogranum marinum]MBM9512064.1 hypothetical protein [Desulfogranum marinum]